MPALGDRTPSDPFPERKGESATATHALAPASFRLPLPFRDGGGGVRSPGYSTCLLLLLVVTPLKADDPALTYEKDIRPVLKQHCFQCHGEEPKLKGKLDLRTVKTMLRGGSAGPALEPGRPGDSVLWARVEADEMPEGTKKVPAAQKAILKRWIFQGARTARAEPDDPDQARFTAEELGHWSFQPVRRPPVPDNAGATPIDRFLLAGLKERGLPGFSPAAERHALIRRVTFDLTGLPPTPEEIESFADDKSADAYAKLVDRLLASPHYGERWARHWLDAAGYAETDGGPGRDTDRPHAWRYRDYVVRSLDTDKPIDLFFREQLAGDEMATDRADPATIDRLTATGFLRMAPDATADSDTPADRNQAAADSFKVTAGAMLGLTVGCAQCHDHKYDPVPAEDYYRLRAVFDPAFDLKRWKKPQERLTDLTTPEVVAEIRLAECRAAAKKHELEVSKDEAGRVVYERELAKVAEADRPAAIAASELPKEKLSPDQKALLERYPNFKPHKFIRNFLVEYDKDAHDRNKKLEAEAEAILASCPPRHLVMTVAEDAAHPPESHVHRRGDPEQPGRPVLPGELTVLTQQRKPALPGKGGRRLAYAAWLTGPDHPLAARVFVNRVWQHHFGRGIVGTPGDFGLNGDRPTHPELLDWLADDFRAHGWQLKRLHRQILLSEAYRQRSTRTPELDRLDGQNKLLGRMSLRRLEAEEVRDAMLAAGGKLAPELGGPSVPVAEDGEGTAVLGRRKVNEGLFAGIEPVGDREFRRSLYVESRRALAGLGMPSELVMRHRTPQFSHVFSSDGYSAGYYSYLWSVVLAADAFSAFTEAGGPYDKAVAARLRQSVFTVGNTVDPAAGYRAFRGRDPKIDALMKQRGFPMTGAKDGPKDPAPTKKPVGKAKPAVGMNRK